MRFENNDSLQAHIETHFLVRNTQPGSAQQSASNERLEAPNASNQVSPSIYVPGGDDKLYNKHIDASTKQFKSNVLGIEAPCIFTIKTEDIEDE